MAHGYRISYLLLASVQESDTSEKGENPGRIDKADVRRLVRDNRRVSASYYTFHNTKVFQVVSSNLQLRSPIAFDYVLHP